MDRGTIPVDHRAVTPIMLPTVHEKRAVATNQKMDLVLSKKLPVATSRRSNSHAVTCSNVLPMAITIDASKPVVPEGSVKKLARNAPTTIPGHNRTPKNRSAATATPEGGQTGEAFVPGNWSTKPSRAVT